MNDQTKHKIEFGDFQTPVWFAQQVCQLLSTKALQPCSILEPTCGLGNILLSVLNEFPSIEMGIGAEINLAYINTLKEQISFKQHESKLKILHIDFFNTNWEEILQTLPDPLLIIGNPPWVTNSALASLGSNNLPQKSNFQNNTGIEAITGASNFDISEWMILKMMGWVQDRQGVIAMLCKTAVARKVLRQTWQRSDQTGSAQIYHFDAQAVFNAAVDACLFVYDTREISTDKTCTIYENIKASTPLQKIGYRNNQLIANIELYEQWKHLENRSRSSYKWRSGIKHDCAKVMELTRVNDSYTNKFGETFQLEQTHLYPMLKSSDIANDKKTTTPRWMLVTQHTVGENTRTLQINSPKT